MRRRKAVWAAKMERGQPPEEPWSRCTLSGRRSHWEKKGEVGGRYGGVDRLGGIIRSEMGSTSRKEPIVRDVQFPKRKMQKKIAIRSV